MIGDVLPAPGSWGGGVRKPVVAVQCGQSGEGLLCLRVGPPVPPQPAARAPPPRASCWPRGGGGGVGSHPSLPGVAAPLCPAEPGRAEPREKCRIVRGESPALEPRGRGGVGEGRRRPRQNFTSPSPASIVCPNIVSLPSHPSHLS